MSERTKTYFISDLHLGAASHQDPIAIERKVVRWLESIRAEAKGLYLLGDIFDFWYELRLAVPKGHTRFLGKLAQLSDEGVDIHLFVGNHDMWYFSYLQQEIGLTVHTTPYSPIIDGRRFYLTHGDGVGCHAWGFRFVRGLFHSRLCQVLFSSLHPRWSFAFAHWVSQCSRTSGNKHDQSYRGEENEYLVRFAKAHSTTPDRADYYLFGHRHILLDLQLPDRSRVLILGDWFNHFSYARFDGRDISLELFEA